MKTITIAAIIAIVFLSHLARSQDKINANLNESLVYGTKEFYREMGMKLGYPLEARRNGVMGLSVFSFRVDCNNEVVDMNFETILNYGIEEEITRQMQALKVNWKPCNVRPNERIRIKIAFGINKVYEPEEVEIMVNAMGDYRVISDKTLRKQLNKAVKKNKAEKAQEYLKILLARYPFNEEYLKLQTQLNVK